MDIGTSKTSWLSSKKTPLFFEGFCEWSEDIRQNGISASELKKLFSDIDRFKYPIRNKSLFKYKLLIESKFSHEDPLLDEYYDFLNRLRGAGFWLEQAFGTPAFAKNTFLAAQAFLPSIPLEHHNLIAKLHQPADLDRAKKATEYIFSNLQTLLKSNTSAYEPLLNELAGLGKIWAPELSESIAAVHHEVTDNIDHWMYYPNNKRTKENNRRLFGDTLVMEIKFFILGQGSKSREEALQEVRSFFRDYPDEFPDYAASFCTQNYRENWSFVEINYYDNGRGIEENFKNFSSRDQSTNLNQVIRNKMSTRPVDGAGKGFDKIIGQTLSRKGLVFIQSGSHAFCAHPYQISSENNEEAPPREKDIRGTFTSILIPIGAENAK